jgi:hypothetical protein
MLQLMELPAAKAEAVYRKPCQSVYFSHVPDRLVAQGPFDRVFSIFGKTQVVRTLTAATYFVRFV